jgi:hypothetical protein
VFLQNCEWRLSARSCLSVCPSARNNAAPTGRIRMKYDIWVFLEHLPRTLKVYPNITRTHGTLHDVCTLVIISHWILRMRDVLYQSCKQNQNTHFMFSNFIRKSCRLSDNVEKYGTAGLVTDNSIIRRMRIACSITKATDIHSEYVMPFFFKARTVTRMRPSVTYIRTLPVVLILWCASVRIYECNDTLSESGEHKKKKKRNNTLLTSNDCNAFPPNDISTG